MYLFFYVLAWIFGPLATLLLILRIWGRITFIEDDELADLVEDDELADLAQAIFPTTWAGIITIVCWVYIFTIGTGG